MTGWNILQFWHWECLVRHDVYYFRAGLIRRICFHACVNIVANLALYLWLQMALPLYSKYSVQHQKLFL